METEQMLIALDVAAARDANQQRVRMLKSGHAREASQALGVRVANMVSARTRAGQDEKVPRLLAQLRASR